MAFFFFFLFGISHPVGLAVASPPITGAFKSRDGAGIAEQRSHIEQKHQSTPRSDDAP